MDDEDAAEEVRILVESLRVRKEKEFKTGIDTLRERLGTTRFLQLLSRVQPPEKGWTLLLVTVLWSLDAKRLQKPELVSGLQELVSAAAKVGSVFAVSKTRETMVHLVELVNPAAAEPLKGKSAEQCWRILATLYRDMCSTRSNNKENLSLRSNKIRNNKVIILMKMIIGKP